MSLCPLHGDGSKSNLYHPRHCRPQFCQETTISKFGWGTEQVKTDQVLWKRAAATDPERRNHLSDSKETKKSIFLLVSAKILESDQELTFWAPKWVTLGVKSHFLVTFESLYRKRKKPLFCPLFVSCESDKRFLASRPVAAIRFHKPSELRPNHSCTCSPCSTDSGADFHEQRCRFCAEKWHGLREDFSALSSSQNVHARSTTPKFPKSTPILQTFSQWLLWVLDPGMRCIAAIGCQSFYAD